MGELNHSGILLVQHISYKETYGALYNWYTVNTGKLCPNGWHVPSEDEWATLNEFLGGNDVAGGKLKETGSAWHSPNAGATNETGFTALPGGQRKYSYGSFNNMSWGDYWWSATNTGTDNQNGRGIAYHQANISHIGTKDQGYSVRCIKD